MNIDLKQRLKEKFKPLGILAYSNCEYAEDDDFKGRENGIILFRPLKNSKIIYVFYFNYEYLNDHLDEELKLIDEWISIVGAQIEEIIVPALGSVSCAIKVSLKKLNFIYYFK